MSPNQLCAEHSNAGQTHAERLIAALRGMRRVAVAFSGGVDSSVVAAAARRAALDLTQGANLEQAIAVTAKSASLSETQLDIATRVAGEIGIEHRVISTDEGDRHEYRRNDGRRCFFCKQTLYAAMGEIARQFPGMQLVSGTNADDLSDYRPGLEAGKLASVRTPLADLGITKVDVRAMAQYFGLSNHDLPAAPCLASRIAYGVEVTPERLRQIERAEDWLRRRGFDELRVRLHDGGLARIEVPQTRITELVALDCDGALTTAMKAFGFRFVAIDQDGFQSGKLNQMLVSIGDGSGGVATLGNHAGGTDTEVAG